MSTRTPSTTAIQRATPESRLRPDALAGGGRVEDLRRCAGGPTPPRRAGGGGAAREYAALLSNISAFIMPAVRALGQELACIFLREASILAAASNGELIGAIIDRSAER